MQTGLCFASLCLGTLALAGCQALATLGGAVSQVEVFSYSYVRLTPDVNGKVALRLDLGIGCDEWRIDKSALAQALSTGHLTIPTAPAPTTVPFSFESLQRCMTLAERRFETTDLEELVRDANGKVTGKRRPSNAAGLKLVDAGISSGGVISARVFGFQFAANTVSSSAAPGPLENNEMDVPQDQVAGASASYSTLNENPTYFQGTLLDVLDNPPRISLNFSFLAKTTTGSPELLLVGDGEMVMRTDL
jgi:hypothetical protein